MTLKLFVEMVFNMAAGVIFLSICGYIATVIVVYGYKYTLTLIKSSDVNIERFKNVRVFKDHKAKRRIVSN